jgi:hypothetical protein
MERLGWRKRGKKGLLGVRAKVAKGTKRPGAYHNTGGLAFWFLRAERYERIDEMPFRSVKNRAEESTKGNGKSVSTIVSNEACSPDHQPTSGVGRRSVEINC